MVGFKPVKSADLNPSLTNTLWFSLEVLVSSGGGRYFSFMPLTPEAIQHINWIVEDLKSRKQRLLRFGKISGYIYTHTHTHIYIFKTFCKAIKLAK